MKTSQKGQVLVIFSLALVAILGFVAVAIDGSLIYSDRRYAQNAADAAALAGINAASLAMANNSAYWWNNFNCNQVQALKDAAIPKAIQRAADNKYTITEQDLDVANHGVEIDCQNTATQKYLFVRVKITTNVSTSFAHLFFGGAIKNTVEGVSRVKPRMPLAFGSAIVATDPNCSYDGINLDGVVKLNVFEGGIYSNSCMTKNGTAGNIYVPDSAVSYYTTFSGSGGNPPFTAATPGKANAAFSMPPMPTVDCNVVTDFRGTSPSANLTPGRYDAMSGNRFLAPGLYCFYGDVSLSGSNNVFHGDNVTIYFVNGGFKITGGGDIQLSASTAKNPAGHAQQDVVVMMAPSNTSDLTIEGNANSYFTGLILAPNQAIDLGGCDSTEAYHAQVIGRNVKYHGTTTVNVTFFNSERFMTPVTIDMSK